MNGVDPERGERDEDVERGVLVERERDERHGIQRWPSVCEPRRAREQRREQEPEQSVEPEEAWRNVDLRRVVVVSVRYVEQVGHRLLSIAHTHR